MTTTNRNTTLSILQVHAPYEATLYACGGSMYFDVHGGGPWFVSVLVR